MRRRAALIMTAGIAAMIFALGGPASVGAQSTEDDPAQVEAGMAVFEANCAGCHGANGEGSNTGRPLADVANEADRGVHIGSVTNGKGNMPAFGERLDATEIDAAVSYVRLTFVSAQAEPELAVTGPTQNWLAGLGVAAVLAGGVMLATQRRRLA